MKSIQPLFLFVGIALLGSSVSYAQKLIVIRHGEALSNVKGLVNSVVEESVKYPLSERGRNQVAAAAQKMAQDPAIRGEEIQWVYVSPFLRTRQTAEILIEGLGIDPKKMLIDYSLAEAGMGSFEGRAIDLQIMANPDWARAYFGESMDDVHTRMATFLDRMMMLHPRDVILAVTHGSPMVQLHRAAEPEAPAIRPDNAEFQILIRSKPMRSSKE